MALFAEARKFLGNVCRICVTRSDSHSLSRAPHSCRFQSLNTEIVCQAVALNATPESCAVKINRNDVVEVRDSPLKGQESLNNEMSFDAETAMISIMNLKNLLGILPSSSEELSTAIDHICDGEETDGRFSVSDFPATKQQDYVLDNYDTCLFVVRTNKHLMDGRYLDKLYEIHKGVSSKNVTTCTTRHKCLETNPNDYFPVVGILQESSWPLERLMSSNENMLRKHDVYNDQSQSSITKSCVLDERHNTQSSINGGGVFSSHMLFCDSNTPPDTSAAPCGGDESRNLPTQDQLNNMYKYLGNYMPNAFSVKHEYRIYVQDIIFENNYVKKPYVSVGINPYVMFMVKSRLWAHFKYANVRLHLLKITMNEDDGTIRARWRISGLPQIRAFMFWKFLPWKYRSSLKDESEWLDGFSTFYVQPKTGLIYKHRLDKVISDEEVVVKKTAQEKLVEKLQGGLNVGTV